MLEEFKKFAMRGNVIDLAVGVIIGAAFGAVLGWGQFLTVALNFLIVAWVLFLAIQGIMKLKKEEAAAPAPGPTAEVKLLTEIRDLLKK